MAKTMGAKEIQDRQSNEKLWEQLQTTIYQKQQNEFTQTKGDAHIPIGSTKGEIGNEKHLIVKKAKAGENKENKLAARRNARERS